MSTRLAAARLAGAAAVLAAAWQPAQAAAAGSRYLELAADRVVEAAPALLLETTLDMPRAAWIYLQSDGVHAPVDATQANAYITVDGRLASNDSIIDWRGSRAPNQHAFNAIGAVRAGPGRVHIALRARTAGGKALVKAGANLSILAEPAARVVEMRMDEASPWLDFDTRDTPEGTPIPERGRRALLAAAAGNAAGPVVAMASGRSYVSQSPGDAMWGLFLNGRESPLDSATWSINDLFAPGAEVQAPMFVQALYPDPPANSEVQLVASESPYYKPRMASTNAARYRVGRGARLVTLAGGMRVFGRGLAPKHDYAANGRHRRYAYTCIGTNGYRPEKCPPLGGDVVIGKGRACIPPGHNGVVMFSAKTRIQGDEADPGGTVSLRLRINGRDVGATSRQTLGPLPHSVSTRTIGASYLATGKRALPEGCHDVEAVGHATGDFRNISYNVDLPLLWFD
ncbi:hypothetical protein WCE41_09760 [Luteimonas sp. MJ246]|uniref:hypothetical protein n=1 Tax=Luteimonas sp. MJ174 TaxID=3129237 RepID=UPI0031B9B618